MVHRPLLLTTHYRITTSELITHQYSHNPFFHCQAIENIVNPKTTVFLLLDPVESGKRGVGNGELLIGCRCFFCSLKITWRGLIRGEKRVVVRGIVSGVRGGALFSGVKYPCGTTDRWHSSHSESALNPRRQIQSSSLSRFLQNNRTTSQVPGNLGSSRITVNSSSSSSRLVWTMTIDGHLPRRSNYEAVITL